ncbi:T6SS immunity protein Tli4 family protein [Cupriavidus campinensis]
MKRLLPLLITSLALALPACGKPRPLTLQEQQTVNALTSNLVPRCVGRYLIDMPADAKMSGMAVMQHARVDTQAMPLDAFEKEIAAREAQLKATKSIDAYPFLYANSPAWDAHSRFLMHRGAPDNAPNRRIFEGYRWDNGTRISVKATGWDYTNPDRTDDPMVKSMTQVTNVREISNQVFELLTQFRGRADDEIPAEPGFCIPGGLLRGAARAGESVDYTFRLKPLPDVKFSMSTYSDLQEAETLLQRHVQINAALALSNGRTVRKGKVVLPGWHAEEWLMERDMPATKVRGHVFTLEGNSMTGTPQTPYVDLDMINGVPTLNHEPLPKASLTEAEALALWDAVSRTLRPRPNGF